VSAVRSDGRGAAAIEALVLAARRGDESAWEGLVSEFAGLVWSIARAHRLDAADAADVSQTTWLRLAENLDRIREPRRVGAWLAATARHECLRTVRRAGREVPAGEVEPEPAQASGPSAADRLFRTERDAALWQGFGGLSESCQSLLRILMGDPAPSYEEVSEALDMPVGSIGPTRARCLERLRALVARGGIYSTAPDSY